MSRFGNVNKNFSAHACAYIVRMDNPRFDRDVADEDAIMNVEEGGVEVGKSAVPAPSESGDESEIDRR